MVASNFPETATVPASAAAATYARRAPRLAAAYHTPSEESAREAVHDAGLVRRGYFVAGLGGAQFALRGAVERLRDEHEHSGWWLLAACDPANAWGAALSWPPSDGHRPSRGPGGLVVLENGSPVLYVERGAHTVVTFGRPSATRLTTALNLIGTAIDEGRLDEITVRRINDGPALDARDLVSSLVAAGYRMVPQGFRRRPST